MDKYLGMSTALLYKECSVTKQNWGGGGGKSAALHHFKELTSLFKLTEQLVIRV